MPCPSWPVVRTPLSIRPPARSAEPAAATSARGSDKDARLARGSDKDARLARGSDQDARLARDSNEDARSVSRSDEVCG
jgi:hypothetical protein